MVIFYIEILTGKVVLWCLISSETSEKIRNSTFRAFISYFCLFLRNVNYLTKVTTYLIKNLHFRKDVDQALVEQNESFLWH